jgi:hypothetical protein
MAAAVGPLPVVCVCMWSRLCASVSHSDRLLFLLCCVCMSSCLCARLLQSLVILPVVLCVSVNTSAQTESHIKKYFNYENSSTAFFINNNFKQLMMTILAETCSVMSCRKTSEVNNF